LFNASRTYLKAKKRRRLAKLARRNEGVNSSDEGDLPPEAEIYQQPKESMEEQRRDMYKRMDGSALLAIGVFSRLPAVVYFSTFSRYVTPGTCGPTSGSEDPRRLGEIHSGR
jgi:hypothetical protein